MSRISFIGAGNMARSLLGGLIAGGAAQLTAADPDADARAAAAALGDVATTADNGEAVAAADAVVLAVKPQALASVLAPLRPQLAAARPLLISVAAGVRLEALQSWGGGAPLIRAMPNTPALIGAGITALVAGPDVTEDQRALATALFEGVGETLWLDDEADLDAVTALSGSGPAYLFRFIEALAAGGEALGLAPESAARLAVATVRGAALMAAAGSDSPATLRRRVTSPGGTTAAALATLDARAFDDVIAAALQAAADRSRALAAEFSPGGAATVAADSPRGD